MYNKKLIIGIATGVAVLAVAGILIAGRKKSRKEQLSDKANDLSDNFRSKLNSLQRKAQKEFKEIIERGEDFANTAKDRASDWAKKASTT